MAKKYTRKLTRRSSKRGGAPPVKKKTKTPAQALIKAHMGIYKKAGPAILKKAKQTGVNAAKGAKHMVNLMGMKASEIAKDWWLSVGRPGFMAQPPEYGIKQKQGLALTNTVKQIEDETSIRRRLQLPANIEISDVKRIYGTIESQFKQILKSVNNCDEFMYTLKPKAIDELSKYFIHCIDTKNTPWTVTEQIRQGCVMSVRELKPYHTFKDMSEVTDFMKLFCQSMEHTQYHIGYETIKHFVNQQVGQSSSRGSSKKKKTKKKKKSKKKK
jgi:hypothetical protein